ncbi:MAG: serine/threonine protein kinase, partial [Acidobacteria bacterium]|nr:serine/threonine protein kinase [Acidobacteriota bacterium]
NILTDWNSVEGLAWSPDGSEIWFSGERPGFARSINATTLDGRTRLIATSAGALWLQDVAKDGRVLATRENFTSGILATLPGETKDRDLSWLDFSIVRDLSNDGKTIVFSESGEAGGSIYGIYVRGTGASPAIRLGEGTTEALSPDGKWVLSIPRNRTPAQIVMLPIGAGEPRAVTHDAINHRAARFFPDGRSIFFQGNEPGRPPRMWMQPLEGGPPRPLTPENVSGRVLTPDGRRLLAAGTDRKFALIAIDGSTPPIPVPALRAGDVPMRFAADGTLFVASFGKIPALLYRVNLTTGERTIAREAMPADAAGLTNVGPIFTTPDAKTFVYSYSRLLSDLYLVDAK